MKLVFRLPAVYAIVALFSLSLVLPGLSQSVAQSKAAPALSFDVTASAVRTGSKNTVQAMNAKVHLRGERARVETRLGSQNLVLLMAPPYVYRLLPASKAGVRYKSSTLMPEMGTLMPNWQELMAQPQQIRTTLRQKGARKTGSATLGGIRVDVYSAQKWEGKPRQVRLWLRQSDALPLRMETIANGTTLTVNWKNYRRGHTLPTSLFAVPKTYQIRDGQSPR